MKRAPNEAKVGLECLRRCFGTFKGLKHYKTRVKRPFSTHPGGEGPGQEGVGGGKPPPKLALERRGSADFDPILAPFWP